MSQSPAVEDEMRSAYDPESLFRKHLKQVNDLLNNNGTLSGHERNCCFLNLGQQRFGTMSAAVGFDYDDDTRAVATVDWDGDGDLDVWTTNRTSPRIRLLRNDLSRNNHFLQLKLIGRTCNRDAIGARVEVTLDPPSQHRLVQTLRAGEGFLTQQSKWLHFGLSNGNAVKEVSVQWPDGRTEIFSQITADHRYVLEQSTGQPVLAPERPPTEPLVATPRAQATTRARIPLTVPIPSPRLPYSNQTGGERHADTKRTLLILWSSRCGACLEELPRLSQAVAALSKQTLRVVAVNVDAMLEGGVNAPFSDNVLSELHSSIELGFATPELIKRVQLLYDMPFASPVELATPTGFLFNDRRELTVIYRGAIDPQALLADVDRMGLSQDAWATLAQPMRGRWSQQPSRDLQLLQIPRQLVDRGYLDDASRYVSRNVGSLREETEFAKLNVWIADQLIHQRRTAEAMRHYIWALETNSNDVTVMNNVAWQFATHPDSSVRNPRQAVRWAEQAAKLTQYRVAGVLDTLAASYAAAEQFPKAIQVIDRALQFTKRDGDSELANKLRKRRETYRNGRALFLSP